MPKKSKKKKTSLKKRKARIRIIKWTSLIILLVTAILLFLLSNLFNIKQINVINNSKITSEEIINLAGIHVNENMFKFLKFKSVQNIKTNPYIEDAKIHRKLNGTIEITVTERVATYMLPLDEDQYAYINNQGYILEISSEKTELPILTGYTTENIVEAERLDVDDLKKINIVIKIMNTAGERKIAERITKIDCNNTQNIILMMENEGKIINFGNEKNINDKFVKLMAVLEDTNRTKRRNFFTKYK